MIQNFLKFSGSRHTLLRRQIRFAPQINGIESKRKRGIRLSEFIRRRYNKGVDGLFAVAAVKRDCRPDHRDKIELYDGVFAETFDQVAGQSRGLRGITSQSQCNRGVTFRLSTLA